MDKIIVSIYALINPLDDNIFYVGCTSCTWNRFKQHISSAKSGNTDYKSQIIREIRSLNKEMEMLVLEDCDVMEATFLEEFYINLFKSYGFTLSQWDKSTYSITYANAVFSGFNLRTKDVSINSKTVQTLSAISKTMNLTPEFLIAIALEQFTDKYKNIVESNDSKMKDRLHKVDRELLIKRHLSLK
jgi:hypothetical protein